MTAESDQLLANIVAAVQSELDRHAKVIEAENADLRAELTADRTTLRTSFGEQVATLVEAIEQLQARQEQAQRSVRDQVDVLVSQRLAELTAKVADVDNRAERRSDELRSGLDVLVEGAARPLLQAVRDDQESVRLRVDALGENLRQFDEQAARMVTWVNDVQVAAQSRSDEHAAHLEAELERRIGEISNRVVETEAGVVRRHTETSQMVTQRVGDAEERLNGRVLALESRIKEETGARLAEMDAHLGRVSQGLDNTLTVLNDRMAAIEQWLQGLDDRLERAKAEFSSIDTAAIEELKERLSTAAGEAMLVRIEMERLQKQVHEQVETVTVRVTAVEAQLADATMDVSTAVQLERLEELERAVMELDPDTFVRREPSSAAAGDPSGER